MVPRFRSFDPANPTAGDFHAFTSADRFNYNGPTYNYLRTPNERSNLFASVRHTIGPSSELFGTMSYTHRSSATKAAPEPLCLGNGCGNPINSNFVISMRRTRTTPFGVDLSVAAGTLEFFGRRPPWSPVAVCSSRTPHTYFATIGVAGEFDRNGRPVYWEAYGSYGENQGFQTKRNSHNAAKLAGGYGRPVGLRRRPPGCVPFNFFGGQGPDGNGSITRRDARLRDLHAAGRESPDPHQFRLQRQRRPGSPAPLERSASQRAWSTGITLAGSTPTRSRSAARPPAFPQVGPKAASTSWNSTANSVCR